MALENVPRCRHVKVNGVQCGSPALRRRRYCFFHHRMLDGKRRFAENLGKPRPLFSMCLIEDANAVQVALMQVLQLLGSGQMDHKTAGLMLYGLQTASCNLRHTDFEAEDVTDVVIDRDTVDRTSINGPQWFEEDFDEESEPIPEGNSEQEIEGEAERDSEHAGQGELVAPGSVSQKAPEVEQITIEEARRRVQGAVRNWLLETATGNAEAKPG
jgi:hypothetical protein